MTDRDFNPQRLTFWPQFGSLSNINSPVFATEFVLRCRICAAVLVRFKICPEMSHAGQFWLSGFQIASDFARIASDLARIGDLRAFRRPVARTDYAFGLIAAKKLAKPVTGTRGRGSTVTRAMPAPASRGTGLRGTRHQGPIRIRTALATQTAGAFAGCGRNSIKTD